MTKKAIEAVRAKARAYKTYRKTNSHFHAFKFKRLRNVATAEVKKAKKNFEHKLSSECKLNPKAFWKYVKSKTITRDTIGNLTYNGVTADTDISKANLLNSFFAQVFTREDMTTLPVIEETQGIYFTNAIQVTTNAVLNKLNLLNANKSAGPDGLHPRVLKELAVSIANPICFLMNKCFAEGKIPISWKTANVCCIFKKGSKLDPGNYRPISLTNILCKMAESFIKEAVYEHLGANNILSNCQHGFRTHMSRITQLLEVTEALTKRYEEGLTTDIIYLDFQKAFDKVPHNRLIRKLFCYGIRGRILDFIADFDFNVNNG